MLYMYVCMYVYIYHMYKNIKYTICMLYICIYIYIYIKQRIYMYKYITLYIIVIIKFLSERLSL